MICRLGDGILFAVAAQAFFQSGSAPGHAVAARTAPLVAILRPSRRAVVAGGYDSLVLHNDGCDLALDTIAAHGHNPGDVHEILIPVGTREIAHETRQQHIELTVQVLESAVVGHGHIGQLLSQTQLLARRIPAL